MYSISMNYACNVLCFCFVVVSVVLNEINDIEVPFSEVKLHNFSFMNG